jgi:hypothetical protein
LPFPFLPPLQRPRVFCQLNEKFLSSLKRLSRGAKLANKD